MSIFSERSFSGLSDFSELPRRSLPYCEARKLPIRSSEQIAVRVAFGDGGARHSADDAAFFALGDGEAAGGFDYTETLGAVFAHAGHQNTDSGERKFLGDRMKKHIYGRAMPVHGGASVKTTMSPRGMRRTIMWRLPGHNEHAAREEKSPDLRFLHFEGASTRRDAWQTSR